MIANNGSELHLRLIMGNELVFGEFGFFRTLMLSLVCEFEWHLEQHYVVLNSLDFFLRL